jgi:hypothetical protein
MHEELLREESEPRCGELIRVTIIARIAKNVETRPKDKARVSLIETNWLKLNQTWCRCGVTYACCFLSELDFGGRSRRRFLFAKEQHEILRSTRNLYFCTIAFGLERSRKAGDMQIVCKTAVRSPRVLLLCTFTASFKRGELEDSRQPHFRSQPTTRRKAQLRRKRKAETNQSGRVKPDSIRGQLALTPLFNSSNRREVFPYQK